MELDQAFVINGDDLRIVLGEGAGNLNLVHEPRETAERILRAIRVPNTAVMSRVQLTKAVRSCKITQAYGNPKDADWIAGLLLEAMAVPKDETGQDPWAPDDDVVDAHVHCDHAPESSAASELEIADQVVRLLQPLGYAGSRRLRRVLRWAWDYLTDGDEPPF